MAERAATVSALPGAVAMPGMGAGDIPCAMATWVVVIRTGMAARIPHGDSVLTFVPHFPADGESGSFGDSAAAPPL